MYGNNGESTTLNQTPQVRLRVPGMLLELPVPVLSQMLQDEAMMTAAVEKALRALQLAQEPRYGSGQEVATPTISPRTGWSQRVCGPSEGLISEPDAFPAEE